MHGQVRIIFFSVSLATKKKKHTDATQKKEGKVGPKQCYLLSFISFCVTSFFHAYANDRFEEHGAAYIQRKCP